MRSIPVITYHHVNEQVGDTVTVSSDYFEGQLKYLSDQGYESIFLDDLVAYIKKGKLLPRKTVALTFDDGYFDNWLYAFPLLKKYQMKATIFIITLLVKDVRSERPDILPHGQVRPKTVMGKGPSDYYLTWEEMREMKDSGLVDIQSHTHSHQKLDSPEVDYGKELSFSKKLIDENLKKDCHFISWPWGACSDEVVAIARQLGYWGGVATRKGANTHSTDSMRIRRFDTEKGNLGWFSRRLRLYSHPTMAKVYSILRSGL